MSSASDSYECAVRLLHAINERNWPGTPIIPLPDLDGVLTQIDHLTAHLVRATAWMPIETAPKDGSRFWGDDGDDAIAMFWHEGFGEFVSSFRRMEMAPGYTINGKSYEDHHPEVHKPSWWMPMLATPPNPHSNTTPIAFRRQG